jgi:UDP-glucuronate decarboxylase
MAEIAARLGGAAERFAGRTVLITGAGGMLPGYLADTLAYLNDHVLRTPARLVLLTRTHPTPGSRLAHLTGRADVRYLVRDARDPIELDGPVHFIIHGASPATPPQFAQDPVGTVEVNTIALRNLLDLARQRETESVLFFSSSEVYGTPEPEHIPTPETYLGRFDFTLARSFYAAAKRFGETLCAAYFQQYGVPVKSVRPFHVHGPGLRRDDGRIVAAMIARGLAGEPFELQSDGSATRTYGYIADATLGFLNVLLTLATTIARLFGRTEPVRAGTALSGAGSPARACPDLTKIRSLLGYETLVPLEAGLERTIEWMRADARLDERMKQ